MPVIVDSVKKVCSLSRRFWRYWAGARRLIGSLIREIGVQTHEIGVQTH
jgi:hypothetical protein